MEDISFCLFISLLRAFSPPLTNRQHIKGIFNKSSVKQSSFALHNAALGTTPSTYNLCTCVNVNAVN